MFSLSDDSHIVDVDECETDTDDCHWNAQCNDLYGSYTCTCNSGYTGNVQLCYGTQV